MYVCMFLYNTISIFLVRNKGNETDIQIDASIDELVAACGHPRSTIQTDIEADRLAEEPE